MIGRRRLLGTGVAAGVLGAIGAAPDAEAGQRNNDQDFERLARSVDEVRDALRQQRQFGEITAVRDQQKLFLRGNGKLPDFIEVGLDLWFAIYDWHIRWQQPIVMGRDPNGRYTIKLIETTIILRTETQGNFVGLPYDNPR